MSKSDWDYFNCSEDYEVNYVANLYLDSSKVKEFIKKECRLGNINNMTHKDLYELLKKNKFIKK